MEIKKEVLLDIIQEKRKKISSSFNGICRSNKDGCKCMAKQVILLNYKAFLEETFDVVLKNKSVGLVRADSGFYSDN